MQNVILAPESMHHKILEAAHISWVAGHIGGDKTLSRVQSNFWWPGITADAERFVKDCTRCQEAQLGTPQKAPLQSLCTAGEPRSKRHQTRNDPPQHSRRNQGMAGQDPAFQTDPTGGRNFCK